MSAAPCRPASPTTDDEHAPHKRGKQYTLQDQGDDVAVYIAGRDQNQDPSHCVADGDEGELVLGEGSRPRRDVMCTLRMNEDSAGWLGRAPDSAHVDGAPST